VEGLIMRNLLLAGAAASLMLFGAAGAANADNANVPANSPYAVMGGGALPSPYAYPAYGYDQDQDPALVEGRSAYVDPNYDDEGPAYVDPGYGRYIYGGPIGGFGGGRHFNGGHFGGGHFGGGHFGGRNK
jgi:hypothetical protein